MTEIRRITQQEALEYLDPGARLNAAAQDMLKALQAMTDATEMFGPPKLRAARDLAFRAIAKAEGR